MAGWLEPVLVAVAIMVALWALLVVLAARRVPRQVLLEDWPGDPRLLERLLGQRGLTARGGYEQSPVGRDVDHRRRPC